MEKTIPAISGVGKEVTERQRYFPALNGYRAIAAFMVYLFHYHNFIRPEWGWFTHNFVHEFHVGVVLFFTLSGFLITARYYDTFLHPEFSLKRYIVNRVIRIYPLYFILTTLTFIPIVVKSFADPGRNYWSMIILYLLNISFLRGFFENLLLTGIGPGWSLTPEECFYISAPFIVLAIYKHKSAFIIIPAAVLLLGFLLVRICHPLHLYGLMDNNMFMLTNTFFGRSMEFIMGAGAALLLVQHSNTGQVNNDRGWKTATGMLWVIICIVILAFLLRTGGIPKGAYHPFGIVVNTLLLPAGAALMLTGLATERTITGRILSSPVMQLLGKSSFAFYLIHVSFIQNFILAHITRNYIADLLLLILLSIFIYKCVELPVSGLLKRRFISSRE